MRFQCINKRCKAERQMTVEEARRLRELPSCEKCFMPMLLMQAGK